jgi:phage gp29-like protein
MNGFALVKDARAVGIKESLMWVRKKRYITMEAQIQALAALQRIKDERVKLLEEAAISNRALIAELSQARKGLIDLAKARKKQLRDSSIEPVGLEDVAELHIAVMETQLNEALDRIYSLEMAEAYKE